CHSFLFFFHRSAPHRDLPSFPTRRSSDLAVDGAALAANGLPVEAVLQALSANDARIPGGHVSVGDRRFSVSTHSDWQSEADLREDRKSTRLNSSHSQISYAVFCLKKKKKK